MLRRAMQAPYRLLLASFIRFEVWTKINFRHSHWNSGGAVIYIYIYIAHNLCLWAGVSATEVKAVSFSAAVRCNVSTDQWTDFTWSSFLLPSHTVTHTVSVQLHGVAHHPCSTSTVSQCLSLQPFLCAHRVKSLSSAQLDALWTLSWWSAAMSPLSLSHDHSGSCDVLIVESINSASLYDTDCN